MNAVRVAELNHLVRCEALTYYLCVEKERVSVYQSASPKADAQTAVKLPSGTKGEAWKRWTDNG